MAAFDAANVDVYALSYDEPEALKDFRDAHGITYTLLSDPDSDVIRSFGILNTLIAEDDHPWFGIPYPGTYILDNQGVITDKFFDSNLAVRVGPEQLMRAVAGESVAVQSSDDANPEEVHVSVSLDGTALTSTVQRDLVVRFHVPQGRHVYALPAPEGSVAVDIELDENEALVIRPIQRPESESHTLEGTGETFLVHHDTFELRLPLTVNSLLREAEITVSGVVRWQSCDDQVCDIPTSQKFALAIPIQKTPPVAIGSEEGAAREPNAMAHFQKMTTRRTS